MSGARRAEPTTRAYIGLGSNLEQPLDQVTRALAALERIPATRLVARSSLYRSPPLGPQDQPPYINAVAALETGLPPHRLLDELQAIEHAHGRARHAQRWGPRTLDLDLLLYGDMQCADERLMLPHPGVHERAFVLYPLLEIAPALVIPGRGPVAELAGTCDRSELKVVQHAP